MRFRKDRIILIVLLAVLTTAGVAFAQNSPRIDNPLNIPDLRQTLPPATDRQAMSSTLQILLLLTVLSLAPAIFILTTSFTRIIVVLALLRQALGAQQLPPSQVLVGLSLLLTALVMAPTWKSINEHALQPYLAGQITQPEALEQTGEALRGFMIRQIERMGNEEDVYMFWEYQRGKPVAQTEVATWSQVPTLAMVPAFVLSELKTAFVIGFRIYLPFLIIDMVISTVLVSMGMLMLPPVLISMPFKLLLFVLSDGWRLVAGTMLDSFAA
jgi:flagellar biosynthesis protein FliP